METPHDTVGPRKTRWFVGALTVWPVIYFFVFIGVVLVSVGRSGADGPGLWLFVVHIVTMIIGFALLAVYAIDIFKNRGVREDRRVMWLLLVLFLNAPAMLVYWWHYMRAPRTT
jgi:hypothetical protein